MACRTTTWKSWWASVDRGRSRHDLPLRAMDARWKTERAV
jgi:hypothetical protein